MKDTLRKLAEESRHKVYTFVYYCLRSHEEAEDITQEVLMKLWQYGGDIEPERLPGWIMRVARNAVIDSTRKQRTRAGVADGPAVNVDATPAPLSLDGDGEQVVRSRELRETLETALASLAEPYRSIIVMREIQEMSYSEISESLACPLGTVKVYLHRGRRMLRTSLKGKV